MLLEKAGAGMSGFIGGVDRGQSSLFPERLEDWVEEDRPVRVIDLFVDDLDLVDLGFERTTSARTGRPGYHPAVLLKPFIYGYLIASHRAGGWNVRQRGMSN
jgi:transposase